ncbi:MAG: hypothetical protein IIA64_02545 [Planctomycetes bacterium]|nr:hypothetical protein [Planctomycetota bacterium]
MPDRPLKYRKLLKTLRRYGINEVKARGKGSHRMLVGVVDGGLVKHPIKCHNDGEEKPKAVVASIRRVFKLTADNGVTDRDFYQ